MFAIYLVQMFDGQTFNSVKDALSAYVAAGAPDGDPTGGGYRHSPFIQPVAGGSSIALHPRLPDVFAGKSRAEVKAMYDAGVRQWNYRTYWAARIAEMSA